MIIVSACLFGIRCRYDGKELQPRPIADSVEHPRWMPVCPEQLGGLPTPREPAMLQGGDGHAVLDDKAKVVTYSGKDVTQPFLIGVEGVLKIIAMLGAEKAILKEKSPSCGVCLTYINGKLTQGKGVLAAALERAEIPLLPDTAL